MTECKQKEWSFASCKGRKVKADFRGGTISSDGGLVLVKQVDRALGLTKKAARLIGDKRQKGKVRHAVQTMIRQRIFGLCAGYEDLNDFNHLRNDPLFQTVSGTAQALAGASTLCRFENRQNRQVAWEINELLVEQFIASFAQPPEEIILDFDATDDAVHGKQEGRFFHGYYDHYCFLPLYVFCGDQLLVAYLRPSNQDAAKHAAAILKLLVERIRRSWPRVRIIFRADSGFCRDLTLNWCDRRGVDYVVGLARNEVLLREAEPYLEEARERFARTGQKQRIFGAVIYGAKSWKRRRHVIVKAEHNEQGRNPRFVVTSLTDEEPEVYEDVYCARGEMENRVKEQLMLFSDRTSAHLWWTNQWRLLLSALAYVLMESLRRLTLQGTELARAQCETIRLKLIKIGAVITRNTRTIRLHLSSAYPLQKLFALIVRRLVPT